MFERVVIAPHKHINERRTMKRFLKQWEFVRYHYFITCRQQQRHMLYNRYMIICMHTITIYSFHLKYFILYFYTEIAIMWVNALNFLFKQIQTNMTKNILREIKWWKYWIIKTTDNEHFLSLFIFSSKTPYQILQSKVESENMHVHL